MSSDAVPNCPENNNRSWLLVLAAWLCFVIIFFWPVVFQGKVLAPLDILDSLLKPWATAETVNVKNAFTYDAISQYLPYDWSVYQSLRQDGYIGWNPYAHNGTAILENTMICPGDWHHQLYRVLPFWDAWNLGILLQFAIAGIGMLVLLRSLGIPPAYALIGIIGFGFYSQFTLWIYHRWVLGAMCWAPWIVWSLRRAWDKRRKFDPVSCIFIALAFRGGHLQACTFVVLLALLLFISEFLIEPDKKKNAGKLFCLYVSAGLLGLLLSADVLIQTIPPYLSGGKEMPTSGMIHCLMSIPTLATLFFPTLLGTPDGLDVIKATGGDLFDVKFIGTALFILGCLGLFKRSAPLPAKLLFCGGLIIPFTPLDTWMYSRVTTIFSIGCAWLAVWYLAKSANKPYHRKLWKTLFLCFASIIVAWVLASIALDFLRPKLEPAIQKYIVSHLPIDKTLRADWMRQRAITFLDRSCIWHPHNIVALSLFGIGLFCASRIHMGKRHPPAYATLLAICTFGELLLFSSPWITFSDRPKSSDDLFNTPAWVSTLKKEAGNGSVSCYARNVFDYMQLNTPSSHGIRFQNGYETVAPLRCEPLDEHEFDPEDYAKAGVALFLVHPDTIPTKLIDKGWISTHQSKDFKLYRNPAFTSRFHGILANGETIPLPVGRETPNTRTITLPAGTRTVQVAETYSRSWKANIGNDHFPVEKSERNGMTIHLAIPTSEPLTLILTFSPWLKPIYLPVLLVTLIFLAVAEMMQHRKSKPHVAVH